MYQGSRFRPRSGAGFQEIPITWGLIAANVLTFLLAFVGMQAHWGEAMVAWLGLTPASLVRPWTLLTWPLISGLNIIVLLCSCFWAFSMVGSLERSWGTKVFAGFFFACAAITGLTLTLGGLLLKSPVWVGGMSLALAAPTVAWCHINRRETILFNLLIPLPAPVLAWLTVGLTFFSVSLGGGHPLLGLFALSGCGAAYLWMIRDRWLKPRKSAANTNSRFMDFDREVKGEAKPSSNPFTRAAEEKKKRERDKKLEEMFRRSGYDDDGNRS